MVNFRKKIPLWLTAVLILTGFGFGLSWSDSVQGLIKKSGASLAGVTETGGAVKNIQNKLPDYLKKDVDFNLLWDTWDLIREKYYQPDVPDTQIFYGALSGMIGSLGDPYSVFFTPQDSDDFQKELSGEFEGIGAEIGIRKDYLTIISPLEGTPSSRAGLRPGDLVLKIDGQDTFGMSLDKAISLIRGPKGTEVVLNILRGQDKEAKDFKIIRDKIIVKSLTWEFLDDKIIWLKVRQFNGETIPLLNGAVLELAKRKDIKGIILDLRGNPGGYLEGAIDMAGEWIDGQTSVVEKFRDGHSEEHRSDRPARLKDYPTVVLVNQGSASASEIVAGALKDWGKAKIVGMKTFGKGSVQELDNLPDGSSVKLTIAKWFTPKGVSIDEAGIKPDVEVDLTEEDYNNNLDPQLEKAKDILK